MNTTFTRRIATAVAGAAAAAGIFAGITVGVPAATPAAVAAPAGPNCSMTMPANDPGNAGANPLTRAGQLDAAIRNSSSTDRGTAVSCLNH